MSTRSPSASAVQPAQTLHVDSSSVPAGEQKEAHGGGNQHPNANEDSPIFTSFPESLRLVREASDTMFDSVRELKMHVAEIQELLAQTPSQGESANILKDKLLNLDTQS